MNYDTDSVESSCWCYDTDFKS